MKRTELHLMKEIKHSPDGKWATITMGPFSDEASAKEAGTAMQNTIAQAIARQTGAEVINLSQGGKA